MLAYIVIVCNFCGRALMLVCGICCWSVAIHTSSISKHLDIQCMLTVQWLHYYLTSFSNAQISNSSSAIPHTLPSPTIYTLSLLMSCDTHTCTRTHTHTLACSCLATRMCTHTHTHTTNVHMYGIYTITGTTYTNILNFNKTNWSAFFQWRWPQVQCIRERAQGMIGCHCKQAVLLTCGKATVSSTKCA